MKDVLHSLIWATCVIVTITLITGGILYSGYNESEAEKCRDNCIFKDRNDKGYDYHNTDKELDCILDCNEKFQEEATSDKRFLGW